jgi:DNA-binding response OmpR family regulator
VMDEIRIDRAAMKVFVAGQLVPMTATEFRLLDYLTQRPNRVFSRDQLLEAVWSGARFVTDRSVDVYVGRLREKIETHPDSPMYLKTVRGAGYLFERAKDRASA